MNDKKMYLTSLLGIVLCVTYACAYKVLVVFPVPTKSHHILGDGVVKHLLEDGHEVTHMTPFPKAEKTHPLLREIDISSKTSPSFLEGRMNIERILNKKERQGWSYPFTIFLNMQKALFEHEEAQKLFNDPNEHFDVVIVEWMFAELISGISAIFNCPYIWVSTIEPHWIVLRLIDGVPNPAYAPDAKSGLAVPFNFLERVNELMKLTVNYGYLQFYISRLEQEAFEKLLVPIIKKRGHKVPDFDEIRYNASLMLGNSHISMGQPLQLPQSYKAIGGYHIDSKVSEPLPENLKTLLDNAENGLIYFSMGSNLRSKHMPSTLKDSLLKIFGKLKQTVLWKFEEDLPNRSKNVHIIQWAPQTSILAHPNCILFITHGGLLSTAETIYFGKPIIGIPAFADQFTNVDRAVRRGFAKRVDLSYTMAEDLEKAINDILTDPSYTAKAKELSVIFHDRPVPPGRELAHWVRHVARTAGAPHLRSPALMVPWYQKFFLDLAVLILVAPYALKMIIRKLLTRLRKPQKRKVQ